MQRKTNLFYLNDNSKNSKFITFSNYTESLTGNFLSTETKLFPSRFLCLYLPTLDPKSEELYVASGKTNFIRDYICAWYENKMAFLRDQIINENDKERTLDKVLNPLNYLLYIIKEYDNNTEINYIGDITEQDFNGTYTDTICIIDGSNKYLSCPKGIKINNSESTRYQYSEPYLYGWGNTWNDLPNYAKISPKFDINDSREYITSKLVNDIEISLIDNLDINFNIIIPLYDVSNKNIDSISTKLDPLGTTLESSNNTNVPLGIWFADNTIELKRDNSGYAPSWSLSLASQFKPFPYTNKMPNELSADAKTNAFITFSQILTRQNEILDKMSKFQNDLLIIDNKIANINSRLQHIGTGNYTDNIHKHMIEFEDLYSEKLNNLQNELYSYVGNLIWNVNIENNI